MHLRPFCDGSHVNMRKGQEVEPPRGADDGMPEPVPTIEEPTVAFIHELARNGREQIGHHGRMGAMGVPRAELPCWDDLQLLRADLRRRLDIDVAATRLARFFEAAVELMKVLARACAHDSLAAFNRKDLTSWKKDAAELAGVRWAGPTSAA